MEPFHMDNAKDDDHESEEILDLLPPRFREISYSSTAMESFNLMNDDLITHRIIPALGSRLRTLIAKARPGLIADRLRHLKGYDHESEAILDLLPPRFREISYSSTAMESFNLMNDDLISHRIIPALGSRLRTLIAKAKPGLVANRLRHLIDEAPRSRKCSLLFRLIPKMGFEDTVSEMKFIECALRDNRLSPFPRHEFTALTITLFPGDVEENPTGRPMGGPFLEAIGDKVIFWRRFNRLSPFSYILNLGHNSDTDRAFRALDTSAIAEQLPFESCDWITKAIVGDRLIVVLSTPNGVSVLCLDVNTETWSVLADSPGWFSQFHTAIPWKGKLYIADFDQWMLRRTKDPSHIAPMHFDFERNIWVLEGHENTAFARCFMTAIPRHRHSRRKVIMDKGRCIVSSKSGTLYAISHAECFYRMVNADACPIGDIYAMDDLTSGWRRLECRKSEYTIGVDPFKLPKLPVPQNSKKPRCFRAKINCWEINEHDILLVNLQTWNLENGRLGARHAWWIFNKDDGVKNYGWEDLTESGFENVYDISLLKLEI